MSPCGGWQWLSNRGSIPEILVIVRASIVCPENSTVTVFRSMYWVSNRESREKACEKGGFNEFR
jgi:hypothetical protein